MSSIPGAHDQYWRVMGPSEAGSEEFEHPTLVMIAAEVRIAIPARVRVVTMSNVLVLDDAVGYRSPKWVSGKLQAYAALHNHRAEKNSYARCEVELRGRSTLAGYSTESPPLMRASKLSAAVRPDAAKSMRTVESGGQKNSASGMSSIAPTLMSAGIDIPAS